MTMAALLPRKQLEPGRQGRPALGRIRLVLPVWGGRHLDLFLNTALPTLLWPGNVPSLAAALPCEFVVMTGSDDAEALVSHPNWQLLARLCPVRTVVIDDLLSDASYAVTMTLAYAAAIRATGKAMLDTGFIFLAADFLVADGSLAAVLARLRAGASGVLAGNYQVAADALAGGAPFTADAPVTSRALVRWSLGRLHSETRRAIVNAGYRYASSANRLFWRLDDETLLGRFYLMHMIGIRPEVADFTIGAACDYSFIPELCPSGKVVAITDSDEYFCTEMALSAAERVAEEGGEAFDPRRVAADLSRWTTAQQRANARHTILFHAAEIPSRADLRDEADSVIDAISKHLSTAPQPHRDHPYWIGGTALRRATTGRPDPEQGHRRRGAATRLWWRMRLAGFGRPPDLRLWHPRWADFAALRARLDGTVLILSDEPRSFAGWAARLVRNPVSLPRNGFETPARFRRVDAAGPFDRCLLVLPVDGGESLDRLLDFFHRHLQPGGDIMILVIQDLRDDPGSLDPARMTAIEARLRRTGWPMQASYAAAGRSSRRVQQALVDSARATRQASGLMAALGFVACGFLALSNLAVNLVAGPVPVRPARRACSSALFVLRPPACAATEPTSPVAAGIMVG